MPGAVLNGFLHGLFHVVHKTLEVEVLIFSGTLFQFPKDVMLLSTMGFFSKLSLLPGMFFAQWCASKCLTGSWWGEPEQQNPKSDLYYLPVSEE